MRHWKKHRLGELVEILSGFAFDSENFTDSGEMPIVRIRDVVPGRSATFYKGEYDPKYVLCDGDMLIGMDGEFNLARWQGGPALLNQRVCRIAASNAVLDDGYLFRFLPRALKAIEDVTPFVTVKHLSVKTIRDIEIPLPPLAEQRRIAEVLDRAEALRAKRRAALAQLDSLTQSLFLDLFGDSRKESKHPQRVLDECAEVVSGIAKGRKLDGKKKVEAPYLRVANVQAGFLNLSEIKTIEALPSEVAELALKPGDVVLTEGGDHDKLGRGAMWDGQIEGCIHQNHVFRVRPNDSLLLPRFFHEFLQMPAARAYFLRCAKRTTNLASINMTQLRALPVPLPPIPMQREFVRRVTAVEALKTAQRSSLAELDALFATLQHRAFRGEL